MTSPPRLVVTAAVIRRDDAFLVTRRQPGVHLEGYWEFPGGKCDAGESFADCLRREMLEELDVDVRPGLEILTTEHVYPERIVELHFFECELLGDPRPLVGQEMKWVRRQDLRTLQFPAADDELIALLERQC
ncbi:MAG TPA: (deoxy)nucleoside triphosphate pyrophosphohydrolase [Vicinamibacterales bacterium]|nr:(deoxy)nucleoside triphosphate pyrophosphohydrolase [Vicinamibacterales bacterium]